MLETMTYRQYLEWLAFFKIRNEDRRTPAKAGAAHLSGHGTGPKDQKQVDAAVFNFMQSYQWRQDAQKRG